MAAKVTGNDVEQTTHKNNSKPSSTPQALSPAELAKQLKDAMTKEFKTTSLFSKSFEKDSKKFAKDWEKASAAVENKIAKLRRKKQIEDIEITQEMRRKQIEAEMKAGSQVKRNIQDAVKMAEAASNKIQSLLSGGVESFFGTYADLYGKVNTELVDSGKTFDDVFTNLKNGLKGNTVVSLPKVLTQLSKLTGEGIRYNVEQRAFLAEISQKIATTFDASNGTLTRLIRLSGRDMTQAYLGMESLLTKFFNNNYLDNSYLASGTSKSVSEALIEATASMGYKQGTEFEYMVQQMLGSFSSVGVSNNLINKIAQGLGYLGSGQVSALTGDAQLNALFAASANQSGLAYGDLLNGNLNQATAGQLLSGMHSFITQIAKSQDRITQSEYARLFGVSMSDLAGIVQLSHDTIETISKSVHTYELMEKQTLDEIVASSSRTHIKEKMDNAFSTIFANMGENIAGNVGLYVTYKVADMLQKAGVGGIPTPFVGNVDVPGLLKSGILVGTAMTQIGNILSMLGGNSKLNLSNFGGTDTNLKRGTAISLDSLFTPGNSSGTSDITYFGSSDGDSIMKSVISDTETQMREGSEDGMAIETEAEKTLNQIKESTSALAQMTLGKSESVLTDIKNNMLYISQMLSGERGQKETIDRLSELSDGVITLSKSLQEPKEDEYEGMGLLDTIESIRIMIANMSDNLNILVNPII